MQTYWTLLIYTVAATPSRKRATVWRELKKIGAVYLRDGVAALPDDELSVRAFAAIAVKIVDMEGEATLVQSAGLPPDRSAALQALITAARAAEYGEIAGEARGFLEYLQRESSHRAWTLVDLDTLEPDIAKLERWATQTKTRDWLRAPESATVEQLLAQCNEALAELLDPATQAAAVSA